MGVMTLEGIVDEEGQIQLLSDIRLPQKTEVYVVVPDVTDKAAQIATPRLRYPEKAADFKMEVIREAADD